MIVPRVLAKGSVAARCCAVSRTTYPFEDVPDIPRISLDMPRGIFASIAANSNATNALNITVMQVTIFIVNLETGFATLFKKFSYFIYLP